MYTMEFGCSGGVSGGLPSSIDGNNVPSIVGQAVLCGTWYPWALSEFSALFPWASKTALKNEVYQLKKNKFKKLHLLQVTVIFPPEKSQ